MRGSRGKISGSEIGNGGNRGINRGLTRAGRRWQSRRCGGRRRCPSASLARDAGPAVRTIVAMAYDQELAARIRQFTGSDPGMTEKKMFGGLAFLIRGNMAIAASSEGGAIVRVDPAQSDALVATTKATLVKHARPGHARMVAGQFQRSTHRRPASPLGRDRRRVRALAAAQVEARQSAALQPSGPAALIILMCRCVVEDLAGVDDGRGSGSVQIARSFRVRSEPRRRMRSRDGCPVPANLSYC
jgi:TfoX/Sxy family transcriptional regulator of competence genes